MVADRAYLRRARAGVGLARLEAEVARVMAVFAAAGAERVEPAALQPAEVLLDLYGEDIRARAFVTSDDGAELMLRPDFTVPIVRLHLDGAKGPARYAYCGPVWRRQEAGTARPREYLQAGIEVFDAEGADPAATDAAVLAAIRGALGEAPVEIVTGDMGLVLAAVEALDTSPARKAALRRHLWRPARFHALLHRFGVGHRPRQVLPEAAPVTAMGLRGPDEISARLAALATEAEVPPLSAQAVAGVEAVLAVEGSCAEALDRLAELAQELAGIAPAVARFAARLEALAGHGFAPEALRFEARFGRTTLEYYDGFVFGAVARERPDLPPIASGGRYDALTLRLGGRPCPAVGGIVRPEALLALGGGGAC